MINFFSFISEPNFINLSTGGEIESGENKEFLNKNVILDLNYFQNYYKCDDKSKFNHVIIELIALDENNKIECEFATYCNLYSMFSGAGDTKKFNLKIAKQKFKYDGEWYIIHDAFGLGDNSEK